MNDLGVRIVDYLLDNDVRDLLNKQVIFCKNRDDSKCFKNKFK